MFVIYWNVQPCERDWGNSVYRKGVFLLRAQHQLSSSYCYSCLLPTESCWMVPNTVDPSED